MTDSKHFFISGRVQGVSYRASTCQNAHSLGLRGWVRNLPDGRVEALAAGSEPDLEAFERWLWSGPEQAEVTKVDVGSAAPKELAELKGLGDFQVR